jgi:hypothetical protein
MAIDIGRIAYQAYVENKDGSSYYETKLTKWEDLGKVECDAWRHAACAVLQYIDQERKWLELDKAEDIEGFEI